jgi:hypothetical protein
MRVRATIASATVTAALLAGLPAQASAEPPVGPRGNSTAVHACLDYRELIGRDAFREAFVNLPGCVENVVPTTD